MYQLGDRVAVRLEQVDLLSKRINFSLIGKAPLDPLKKDEASGA
jgi:hypothetical protein